MSWRWSSGMVYASAAVVGHLLQLIEQVGRDFELGDELGSGQWAVAGKNGDQYAHFVDRLTDKRLLDRL